MYISKIIELVFFGVEVVVLASCRLFCNNGICRWRQIIG